VKFSALIEIWSAPPSAALWITAGELSQDREHLNQSGVALRLPPHSKFIGKG